MFIKRRRRDVRNLYREYRRSFWILVGATFIDRLGGSLLFPFFALYITREVQRGHDRGGRVLFALFSLSSFAGSFLGGALTDRVGRRRILSFGLLASSFSTLLMGFIESLQAFYVLALIAGIFTDGAGPAVDDLQTAADGQEGLPFLRRYADKGDLQRVPFLVHLAKIGALGMAVPEEYGGLGLPVLDTALVLEEIAKGCYVTAMAVLGEVGVQTKIIDAYAPENIKRRLLPGVCSGDVILAIGMTEPHSGTDVANYRTNTDIVGDRLILNGVKTLISRVDEAQAFVIFSRVNRQPGREGIGCVLIERGTPGRCLVPFAPRLVFLGRTPLGPDIHRPTPRPERSLSEAFALRPQGTGDRPDPGGFALRRDRGDVPHLRCD